MEKLFLVTKSYHFTINIMVQRDLIGETKPRSRKAWAALIGLENKRAWQRLEKELIDNGLIKRHKDDKCGDYDREQEIKFVLPLAKSYRKMQHSDR